MIYLIRHCQWLPDLFKKSSVKYQELIIACVLLFSLGVFSIPGLAQGLPESESAVTTSSVQVNKLEKPTDYLFENTENSILKSALNKLEAWQATMGEYVDDSGEQIDLFFGDEQLDVTRKGSRLDIFLPTTFYDNGKLTTGVSFRAQMDLPRTNQRWKVVLTSFEDSLYDDQSGKAVPGNPNTASNAISGEEDKSTTLAARYLLFAKENMFSHLDFGLKFTDLIDPNPYVRFRTRYKAPLSAKLSSRTTNDVYVERSRGGSIETQQVFDYQWQPKDLLRSQTTGLWSHESGIYLLNQKAIWFQTSNPHRVYAYYVAGDWKADNESVTFTDVSLGMNWREKLYKDWLFGEIEPRAVFHDEDNFKKADLSILFHIEMRFYSLQ